MTHRLYSYRTSDVKSQSVPKDPSAASVYFVKILMDCLCMGPATEKELRNAVIEKCKLSGVKSTTRGTVSGSAQLENKVELITCNQCFHYVL